MRLVQGDRQYFLSSSTGQSITVPWNCCWRIARASRSTRLPLPVSPAEKYDRTTPLPTLLRGAAVIVRRLRASTASTGPTRTAFGAFVTRRAQGRRRTDARRRVSLAGAGIEQDGGRPQTLRCAYGGSSAKFSNQTGRW